jgi:hypothetical protein
LQRADRAWEGIMAHEFQGFSAHGSSRGHHAYAIGADGVLQALYYRESPGALLFPLGRFEGARAIASFGDAGGDHVLVLAERLHHVWTDAGGQPHEATLCGGAEIACLAACTLHEGDRSIVVAADREGALRVGAIRPGHAIEWREVDTDFGIVDSRSH